jgi:hypothetical protein
MPGYNVTSGAAAFSQTLEEAMLNREKEKRQAMLDHLAVQKAAREVDTEANRAEEHKQDLAERKREHDDANRWKETADVKSEVSALNIGQVPDPELTARAKKYGVALPVTPPLAAPPIAGMTPPDMAGQGPGTYKGSPIQQQRQGFVDSVTDPALKRAYQAEQVGLHAVAPPKDAKEPTMVKVVSRDPKSGKNVEQWVTPQEAKDLGQMESPTQPKLPGEGGAKEHFTVQQATDGKGIPIPGKYIRIASDTGMISPAPMAPGMEGLITKATPGAGPMAGKAEARKDILPVLDYMDALVDKAAKSLGPKSGRIADIELKIGDNDPSISALALTMKTVRMMYDAGLGGTRAAASSQLLKQWDDLLPLKATPENLHAVAATARAIMGGTTAAETTAPKKKLTPQEVADKYLSK